MCPAPNIPQRQAPKAASSWHFETRKGTRKYSSRISRSNGFFRIPFPDPINKSFPARMDDGNNR